MGVIHEWGPMRESEEREMRPRGINQISSSTI